MSLGTELSARELGLCVRVLEHIFSAVRSHVMSFKSCNIQRQHCFCGLQAKPCTFSSFWTKWGMKKKDEKNVENAGFDPATSSLLTTCDTDYTNPPTQQDDVTINKITLNWTTAVEHAAKAQNGDFDASFSALVKGSEFSSSLAHKQTIELKDSDTDGGVSVFI